MDGEVAGEGRVSVSVLQNASYTLAGQQRRGGEKQKQQPRVARCCCFAFRPPSPLRATAREIGPVVLGMPGDGIQTDKSWAQRVTRLPSLRQAVGSWLSSLQSIKSSE